MLPRLNEPQSAGVAGGAAIEGVSDVDDRVGAGDERAAEAIDETKQIFGGGRRDGSPRGSSIH